MRVETDYGNWNARRQARLEKKNYGKLKVEYRLTVPRKAILDEIETVNGSVKISNTQQSTKASAVNGNVRATNLRGTARLSTVNGTIEADFDQLQTGSKISLGYGQRKVQFDDSVGCERDRESRYGQRKHH